MGLKPGARVLGAAIISQRPSRHGLIRLDLSQGLKLLAGKGFVG
jgi:hypothetical protein